MKTKINYFAIITFYTIAIGLRYLSNKTTILDNVNSEFIKVILQAVGPAIGAIVAFSIFKIKPKLTLKGNYKNLIIPFILYWIFPIILILTVEYFTKGTFSIIPIFAILIYGLLEEIGWRGFLQHELRSLPKLLNIIIVAILWFIWHLNFEMTSGNILFFGILVLASWGIGKVADSTQSFLAVSAFHSLNNFFPEMNTTKIIILIVLVGTWAILLIDRKKRNQKKEASL
ncbi:CPBP family intramembrane metalloprotease [Flavobacterium sp. P4023]|uniref:CPBP family intramembrane metalloprotease n=1 Tax=Flavobacterium flabelliforme TaxID=2816119 RepID=A0ABS5CVA4_9FLAO|nr:CPBP family intramembrane glutamic endopeptidase [Flavobacterium flabelliforme]MBP4142559.1 CPBP family intramembrane metalloprotease [Flavobacterium flabelliforme]